MACLITLKDIAAKAGVSIATASLALNNHPRITKVTAEKIKRIAKELGYRPNAMLSMFSSYRKARSLEKFQATLGWIDCWKEPGELFQRYKSARQYFEGARQRAEQIGFRLEIFRLHSTEMTEARLSRILFSRGITGLIIPPMQSVGESLQLDWRRFSAVTFSHSLGFPNLHRISFSSSTASLLAVTKLWEIGYRRIAYCPKIVKNSFGIMDMGFLGGYLSIVHQLRGLTYLPPFDASEFEGALNKETKRYFLSWVEKYQPDALLCQDFPLALRWLQDAGYKIPNSMGYADTWIAGYDRPVAGIDSQPEVMGFQAVDFLIGMMRRHETGIPEHPVRIMSDCKWVNGPTTKRAAAFLQTGSQPHIEEELSRLMGASVPVR